MHAYWLPYRKVESHIVDGLVKGPSLGVLEELLDDHAKQKQELLVRGLAWWPANWPRWSRWGRCLSFLLFVLFDYLGAVNTNRARKDVVVAAVQS